MEQWSTTESPSAFSPMPIVASPLPDTIEPGPNPSAERHEAGEDRAEALSALEHLRRSAEQWSRQVYAAFLPTRQRIGRAADQKPVHLIAVVALSAFAAGALLRVWRSSRYE